MKLSETIKYAAAVNAAVNGAVVHTTTMRAAKPSGVATALDCTLSTFSKLLGSESSVVFAFPLPENSTFQAPISDIAYPTSPAGLPALCAVQVAVISNSNSSFNLGLFLPKAWNGRFLAVGNGGFAGGIAWDAMGVGAGYGFATISTDTGHNGTGIDGTWAYNAPEKVIDWGYRAVHDYFSGCSAGGKQGLKEAEMFPADFDGILASAPAWWISHLQLWIVKAGLYNLPVDAPHHIPPSLFPVIGAEVLKQCNPQDGLVDSIISDPARCDFHPQTLLCGSIGSNGTGSGNCLISAQLDTFDHLYNNWVEANQTLVFPHFELGSEAQWTPLVGGTQPSELGTDYIKYMLGLGPDWTWQDFNPSLVALSDQLKPSNATANNFDFSPFYQRGGKIFHYHGYSDGQIATGSSIYFYNHVLRTLRPKGINLDDFYRFFLVPGLQHCAGTPSNMNAPWYFAGANQAQALGNNVHGVPGFEDAQNDVLLALMAWVENGTAPAHIIATKYVNDTTHDAVARQRPLCMYPQQAKYSGQGDVNQAQNWNCESLY